MLTRRASPTDDTPWRDPPKIDGLLAAVPRDAAVREERHFDRHRTVHPGRAPNGRSNGKRNSRLPTSIRLPISRSIAGHSLVAVGRHSRL